MDVIAFREGSRYGSILVDLETRRVVGLLPDREAATLAAWMRALPGVEVAARYRASAYAQAAGEAAPDAVQVADCWHLLKNAREALRRASRHRSTTIRLGLGEASGSPKPAALAGTGAGPEGRPRGEQSCGGSRASLARFDEVRRPHREGASLREIASGFGLHYRTLGRIVLSDACPD